MLLSILLFTLFALHLHHHLASPSLPCLSFLDVLIPVSFQL